MSEESEEEPKSPGQPLSLVESAKAAPGCVGLAVAFVAVFVICGLYAFSGSGNDGGGPAGAEVACQAFVGRQLKAPTSAEFGETRVAQDDDGGYRVYGAVDAENSFGAKVRADYECRVRLDGDDWVLMDLDVDQR